jgi:phosphoglucosamine mutase
VEDEIEALVREPSLLGERRTGPAIGRAVKLEDSRGRYVTFVKNTFPRDLTLDGMRVVVDAAHGAAYVVAPLVFSELGARVHALGVRPNGTNINRECGALHPDHARAEVVRRGAQIGIALDGDADRVIVIDEKGRIVDGDAVMAMCATRMKRDGELRRDTVVGTVMSNLGLERALDAQGIAFVRTPVGDRHVVEAMRRGGFNLGGEQSGHVIFLDHSSTGDGLIAALQVLALVIRTGKPLSELAQEAMERVPQIVESVTLPARRPLEDMASLQRLIAQVRAALGKDGRVLVRWSGTEPKLRVMVEGPDEGRIGTIAQDLVAAARRDVGT